MNSRECFLCYNLFTPFPIYLATGSHIQGTNIMNIFNDKLKAVTTYITTKRTFSSLACYKNSSPTGHQLPHSTSNSINFLEWWELTSATEVGSWSTFAVSNSLVFPWDQRSGESVSSKLAVLTSTKQLWSFSHKRTEEYCFLKMQFYMSLYSNFEYTSKERNRNLQMSNKIINYNSNN